MILCNQMFLIYSAINSALIIFGYVIRAMLNISVQEVVEQQQLIQKVLLKSGQRHYVDIIESKR